MNKQEVFQRAKTEIDRVQDGLLETNGKKRTEVSSLVKLLTDSMESFSELERLGIEGRPRVRLTGVELMTVARAIILFRRLDKFVKAKKKRRYLKRHLAGLLDEVHIFMAHVNQCVG
jgi:hypothetical protein